MTAYLNSENLSKLRANLSIYPIKTFDNEVELELYHYSYNKNINGQLVSENKEKESDFKYLPPLLLCIHGFGEHVGKFEKFFFNLMKIEPVDCLVYNVRSHGEKFITPEKIPEIDIKKTSMDVLTVSEFIAKKFPDRDLYLYGNSLGGATIL